MRHDRHRRRAQRHALIELKAAIRHGLSNGERALFDKTARGLSAKKVADLGRITMEQIAARVGLSLLTPTMSDAKRARLSQEHERLRALIGAIGG